MVDFGFGLVPSSRIDLDKADPKVFEAIVAEAPDVKKCIACGSCVAVCTAGDRSSASLRQAILDMRNGLYDKARSEVLSCQLCGKCFMVCPRGLSTRRIILAISKILNER